MRVPALFNAFLLILVLGSPLTCTQAAPLSLGDESEYFNIVNKTGGYVTPSLHQEFWDLLRLKYDEKRRNHIASDLQKALDVLRSFQAHTWQSAKESYFAKKIEKSREYVLFKEMLEKQQSPYFSPQSMLDYSEKIIEASALRIPLDWDNEKIYVTPEYIEENRVGLPGGYERLKLLLNPVWKEDLKEYILPHIYVSLLALYPPDEYHEVISHENEKMDIHLAQLTTSTHSVYEIGSLDYQNEDKKFSRLNAEEKQQYRKEFIKEQFASFGVTEPTVSQGDWRGNEFSKGMASFNQYNIIIMNFFVNDKAMYIKYITDSNPVQASADFLEFTKRIQLLERPKTVETSGPIRRSIL